VTQAAAYAYFDNKEALFVAAVDADASELIDAALARLPDQRLSTLLPAFLVQLFAQLRDHPLTQRVLAGKEPEVLPRLLALPAVQRTTDRIGEEMRAGQQRGEIRADIDLAALAPGLEVFILSVLVGTVQTGGVATARHQAGIGAAFEAMLLPPRAAPNPDEQDRTSITE
jgi:AcrR family transcriptional regulator